MALTLTNDFIFKYVFGREENLDILLDFINAVLTDSGFKAVQSVELKNPFNMRSAAYLKESILDIKASDEFGVQYDIEVQIVQEPNFAARSLYYWASLYSNQLQKGHEYDELKPVICINIVDYTIFPHLQKFHNCFVIKHLEDNDVVLSLDLVLHYIELAKFASGDSRLSRWLELMQAEGGDTEMTVLIQRDPLIRKAHEEFMRCTQDSEAREIALAREKFQRDKISGIKAAERKGREEGREEGMEEGMEKGMEKGKLEGKFEDARNFKNLGVAVEIIAKATGLSIAEIEKL
jgi:predicted transposase/invertase (TIGR01784 family)